jgi:hypothetical protein
MGMGSNTGRGGQVVKGKMPNAGNKLVIETEPWTNGDAIRDVAYIKTVNTENGTWEFVTVQSVEK